MNKTIIMIIISIFIIITGNSGCIQDNPTNNTWGEKKISIDAIKVSNNTTWNRSETNESQYYVYGYLYNDNQFEALDPKIKITTYYANGTVFAFNDTPYIDPKNLPAKGSSRFYARFYDPDKKITNFTVEVLNAKGELG
ncbi:MAG: hypothetical protein KO316_09720 [Methanobacterium sp.]|jgi:hypothetical protein|nr:hypothetical protein [Methanobacterium sp.]